MSDKYILVNYKPTLVDDLVEWGQWYESNPHSVALTHWKDQRISTVFLGLNHSYFADGPPVLFETMIFSSTNHGDYQERCSTWNEAITQHYLACEIAGMPWWRCLIGLVTTMTMKQCHQAIMTLVISVQRVTQTTMRTLKETIK
jgi:hypothetical protein